MVQGIVNEFDVPMVVTMYYRVLQCDAVYSDGYVRTLRNNLPPYSGWKTKRHSVISIRLGYKAVRILVKVTCTLVQALRAYKGRTDRRRNRGITPLYFDYSTRRGEESASRPGRSLSPGKSRYQLYRILGGLKGRSA
jgi:hypothetical protein